MANILIIDDDVDILSATRLFLKRHFSEVTIEKNPDKIPFLLNNYQFDVILLDMNFTQDVNSGREGFMWLDRILDTNPEAKVVLFTAYGDIDMAVKGIKLGAKDFVLKPWDNDRLLNTLQRAMGEQASKIANISTEIIGQSEVMTKLLTTMRKVANTSANVLVLGENGTGKDLIARAIHEFSDRKLAPFVRVDLAAIPNNLAESELFGHKKGAFTDAHADRKGKFEEAHKGTLFLDEIGNLNMAMQSKILTVLQNRSVCPIGQNKSIDVDIRLISATNMDIFDTQNFRQDLLYRINTIVLEIPALRERDDDIELLAKYFLEKYNQQYHRHLQGFTANLKKEMRRYPWPGNVRELQHAIERAVILCQGQSLDTQDVFGDVRAIKVKGAEPAKSFDLEEMEKTLIIKAIKQFKGNISEAAKELGLSRAALYRRIEKYEI